jgi:subtilisin-like proprotein convertase family protein
MGPACAGGGDIAQAGNAGAATSNQNCPTTQFSAQVQGAPGPIVDVDLALEAVAANTSEVRLWLRSPSSTEVLLFDRRGNSFTDDFFGTSFDDESASPIAGAAGPFHACYRPEQSLTAFDGQDANGTWVLSVQTCLFEASVSSWTVHLDF